MIVGQDQVIEEVLIALLSRGHCIWEGVPALPKGLLMSTLARTLSLAVRRIQFTSDLLPADITGTEVIEEKTGGRESKFLQGPLFANLILVDDINRAPPRTQAVLLEALQERQINVGQVSHRLPDPFFVLATQSPIEQEGTYPLPEAQQDRFMFKLVVKYPSSKEEFEIAVRSTTTMAEEIVPVLSGEQLLELQRLVRRVPVPHYIIEYALALVRQTRRNEPESPKFVRDWLVWGAGPRAVQFLILGGKARCLLHGRTQVRYEDIQALAHPVLRHRLLINFAAMAEGVSTDAIVDKLIQETPIRVDEAAQPVKQEFATQEQLQVIGIGATVYPLRWSLRATAHRVDSGLEFQVTQLSPLFRGHGPTLAMARTDFQEQVHIAFQKLWGLRRSK